MKKIMIKNNSNELKMGSILSYVNLFVGFIIPLFYTPILLEKLGESEYGLYSLANSVIGYLTLLNFGMGNAIVRYVTEYKVENKKKQMEEMIGLFFSFYIFMAGVVCVVGFFIAHYTDAFFATGLSEVEISKLKILLVIMTLSTAFSFPVSVFSSIILVYEKYIFRKIIDFLATILLPVFNLIMLYNNRGSIGIAVIGVCFQVVYLIIYTIYCLTVLKVQPRFKNMPYYKIKEISKFSFFIFMSSVIDMLYWATDKILIGSVLGSVAVGIYNIGGTFTSMLQNLSSAISGVFGTRVTTMVLLGESKEQLSKLLIRIGRLQYLIVSLFLSGYIVFGRAFLVFWAGESYSDSYYIGLLTMIPLAVPLIQSIAFSIIVAQNRHQFRSIVYAIIAIINVISTYLVLPYFGIIGAAVCTSIAYVVGNGIVMNIYYSKVIKLDIILFWKNILQMTVVPIVLCFVWILFHEYVFAIVDLKIFLCSVTIFIAVFLITTWKVSMNTYEKELFKNLLKIK